MKSHENVVNRYRCNYLNVMNSRQINRFLFIPQSPHRTANAWNQFRHLKMRQSNRWSHKCSLSPRRCRYTHQFFIDVTAAVFFFRFYSTYAASSLQTVPARRSHRHLFMIPIAHGFEQKKKKRKNQWSLMVCSTRSSSRYLSFYRPTDFSQIYCRNEHSLHSFVVEPSSQTQHLFYQFIYLFLILFFSVFRVRTNAESLTTRVCTLSVSRISISATGNSYLI